MLIQFQIVYAYLKIGDSVQFVAVFTDSTATIDSVTAEFNSQLLSFSSNTPTTWIATYTVIEGHPSPATSVPLLNLRALDQIVELVHRALQV